VTSNQRLRVGLTRSLFNADNSPAFDFGLDVLQARQDIEWDIIPTEQIELPPELLSQYDAIIVELPGDVTKKSISMAKKLRLVARVGVGYDSVDVGALTEEGIVLTNTPDGVRRTMATAAVTLVLTLSQYVTQRDRFSHEGRWADRGKYVGVGLTGRVLGLVGLGNIGREVARLIQPFGMERVAYDPHISDELARSVNVSRMSLDEVMRRSDFVVITAALTPETHHMIKAEQLAMMKTSAFLVNIARGPIVDQKALTKVLAEQRIAGAGLDVFEVEPLPANDPLTQLDNVVLTAHSIGFTDHCFRDCGVSAIRSVISLAEGRIPQNVVNRAALQHANWEGWEA